MPRATVSVTTSGKVSVSGLLRHFWPTRPSRPVLDTRELPDHMKRDLGILDGSRPVGGVRW